MLYKLRGDKHFDASTLSTQKKKSPVLSIFTQFHTNIYSELPTEWTKLDEWLKQHRKKKPCVRESLLTPF